MMARPGMDVCASFLVFVVRDFGWAFQGGDDVLLYDNITLRGRGALIISFLYCGLFGFSGSRALLVQTSQRHCCTQN